MSILSRKYVLSVTILALFLIMAAKQLITPDMLLWSIMATVISYIAAKSLEKNQCADAKSLQLVVTFWERIKALFSREFMLAYGAVLGLSALLYFGYLPIAYVNTWFIAITTIAASYNIGNSIAKV
jgi:hypothetical protein